jgi:beta-glucosidase
MDSNGIKPRFSFGFGLSYTKFDYSNLQISSSNGGVIISATVKNSGGVDGTEIPQLYLGFPAGAGEPPKVLRGFNELILSAGSSNTVNFILNQRDLRYVYFKPDVT